MEVEVTPGTYKHFKGGVYEVIGVSLHSETKEELVVYRSMKDESLWVRPKEMFLEHVEKPEQNYSGPRFTLIHNSS